MGVVLNPLNQLFGTLPKSVLIREVTLVHMIIPQLDEKHSRLRELRTKAAKDKVPAALT